jgi:probable HAF family extracellular repeat protein
VNNSGQIVGYGKFNGQSRGWIYTDDDGVFSNGGGTIISLGVLPGGYGSYAYALNDSGVVTGRSYTSGGYLHAFRWTAASGMTDLGSLGTATYTTASSAGAGINSAGTVVGYSERSYAIDFHAFVDNGSGMKDLNALTPADLHLSRARAINDAGQIVCDGVLLTPIPVGSPKVSISDVSITEGVPGSFTATFTVTLSQASAQTVKVPYATGSNTALAGVDFTAVSGVLTFAPGQKTLTVGVPIIGDALPEPNETFYLNLGTPTNAALARTQGRATILDDEPRLGIGDVTIVEGNSGIKYAVFTVTLSAPSTVGVSVNYATGNRTATAGADYVATSGTLYFAPGDTTATFEVAIIGDAVVEANETFVVNLSDAFGAYLLDAQGLGTITNDDRGK